MEMNIWSDMRSVHLLCECGLVLKHAERTNMERDFLFECMKNNSKVSSETHLNPLLTLSLSPSLCVYVLHVTNAA